MEMDVFGEEVTPEMKKALDWVPTMIWLSDLNGNCRHVNRAWLEFTGRKLEDALGEGWLSAMHPEDGAIWNTQMSEMNGDIKPFSLECRLRRRDGRYRWLLKSRVPLMSEQGQCVGYVGHCVDVSTQKQALESLHQAKQKHRSLLGNLREAVTTVEDFLHTDDVSAKTHQDDRLTPRQREILHLIARGSATREIATQLHVSVKTVESHRAQLMQRLNIHDVAGLTRYAIRTGLVASDG
ncbi:MAG: helix-turn-helix transcriptional regulator [Pseudomonadota bacterium]|jgi:PAS domain S-box-containing protein|nr:helix-turn-helix transcriptional regulator [Pseudomonadota bacterium]MDP1903609.1 helix-turn-helix transcriptional regulator [Pseudomonadota bacterium]MDP2353923.1 helix-turn-helix transcriptional regulator [Pseudomonadota bacterium]